MSERTEYAPGEFCWVDLATTDVDGAKAFYGELLGDRGRGRAGRSRGDRRLRVPHEGRQDGRRHRAGPVGRGALGLVELHQGRGRRRDRRSGEGRPAAASSSARPTCRTSPGRVAMLRDPTGAFIGIVQQDRTPGRPARQRARRLDLEQPADPRPRGCARTSTARSSAGRAIHNEEAPPGILMWQVEGQRWPEGMGGLMEIDRRPARRDARPLAGLLHRRERGRGDREGHVDWGRRSASGRSTSRSRGWRPWSTRRARWSRSSSRTTPSRGDFGAVRAEPADDDLGPVGLEAGARGAAAGALEVERRLHVLDPAAVAADHVVVGVGCGCPRGASRRRRSPAARCRAARRARVSRRRWGERHRAAARLASERSSSALRCRLRSRSRRCMTTRWEVARRPRSRSSSASSASSRGGLSVFVSVIRIRAT